MSLVFEPERGFVKGKRGKRRVSGFWGVRFGLSPRTPPRPKRPFLNRGPTPPPFPRKRIFEIPPTPKPKGKGVASSRFPQERGEKSLCAASLKVSIFRFLWGEKKYVWMGGKGNRSVHSITFTIEFFYRTEWSGVQRFVSPLPSWIVIAILSALKKNVENQFKNVLKLPIKS